MPAVAMDIAKPADLADARVARIVVGNPRTVPAGQYAEEVRQAEAGRVRGT